MQPISLENEMKVWRRIHRMVIEAQSRYATTLEEDNQLLEEDDKEKKYSYNERNCILFRQGEKIILRFLQIAGERFLKLLTMSQKEARKEVNSYKGFEPCSDYFRQTILPLLVNPNGKYES